MGIDVGKHIQTLEVHVDSGRLRALTLGYHFGLLTLDSQPATLLNLSLL